jgi:hypothetical protein
VIVSIEVSDNIVTVTVEGEGELKSLEDLADQLRMTLKHPVILKLRKLSAVVKGSGFDLAP